MCSELILLSSILHLNKIIIHIITMANFLNSLNKYNGSGLSLTKTKTYGAMQGKTSMYIMATN